MKKLLAAAMIVVAFGATAGMADETELDLGDAGTYYVTDSASIWEESNGLEGLQQEATTDENGREIPADDQVL